MKRIGISQRVTYIVEYGEMRESLDMAWSRLVQSLGAIPIPLTCVVEDVDAYVDMLGLDGVILSGGNDLAGFDTAEGTSEQRDHFEMAVLDCCVARKIPVFGTCRGLQLINVWAGGGLSRVDGHVAKPHVVNWNGKSRTVNSFHGWGIASDQLAPDFQALASDENGFIEAAIALQRGVAGFMWHVERQNPVSTADMDFLKDFFSGGNPS